MTRGSAYATNRHRDTSLESGVMPDVGERFINCPRCYHTVGSFCSRAERAGLSTLKVNPLSNHLVRETYAGAEVGEGLQALKLSTPNSLALAPLNAGSGLALRTSLHSSPRLSLDPAPFLGAHPSMSNGKDIVQLRGNRSANDRISCYVVAPTFSGELVDITAFGNLTIFSKSLGKANVKQNK